MNRQEIPITKCKIFKMENIDQENKISKISIFWMGSAIDQSWKMKKKKNSKSESITKDISKLKGQGENH